MDDFSTAGRSAVALLVALTTVVGFGAVGIAVAQDGNETETDDDPVGLNETGTPTAEDGAAENGTETGTDDGAVDEENQTETRTKASGGGEDEDTETETETGSGGPGFGVVGALVAVVAATLAVARRYR